MTYVLLSLCDYYNYSQHLLLEIESFFNISATELISHNRINIKVRHLLVYSNSSVYICCGYLFQCWDMITNVICGFGGMGDKFDSIVPPIQLWINYSFGGMQLKIEMNPKETLCISQLNINSKVPFLVIEIRIITCKPCDEPLCIFNMHSFFLFLTLTLFFFLFFKGLKYSI
jgi:hypothetical protein